MNLFQALYGQPPPIVLMYHLRLSLVHDVDHALLNCDELLQHLKKNLETATNQMKQATDKKRREVVIQEVDMVFLKLQSHHQLTVFNHAHPKLSSRSFGLYQVIQKVGDVACKLQLPEGRRIHLVFHVSLFKKFIGDSATSTELPIINDEWVIVLEPESIIGTRWVKQDGKFIVDTEKRLQQLNLYFRDNSTNSSSNINLTATFYACQSQKHS